MPPIPPPIASCLLVLVAAGTLPGQDRLYSIADFTGDASGFSRPLVRNGDPGPGGGPTGFGTLTNATEGRWASTEKVLANLAYDFTAVRFWARSDTTPEITLGLTDGTGQTHQFIIPLQGTAWRQYAVKDLGAAQRHFGGADDGVWHPPAQRIQFVVNGPGSTIDLDRVEAVLAASPVPGLEAQARNLARAKTVPLAGFEKDLDGFTGSLARVDEGGKMGKACARLANGDRWVEATRVLDPAARDLVSLSTWVRTETTARVAIRFTDSTGQSFVHRPVVRDDGDWQEVVISDFARTGEVYGGAADKTWHGPAKAVSFILEKPGATVWLDEISVLAVPSTAP